MLPDVVIKELINFWVNILKDRMNDAIICQEVNNGEKIIG